MNWYYVDQGQQAGPVNDAQFEELVRSGKIQPDTLVWREGMSAWQSCREVKSPSPSSGPLPAGGTSYTPGQGAEAVCAECGNMFAIQDMIHHAGALGGIYICANCKPVFLQKLAEGAKLNTGGLNYAGFWTRFAAVFLDGLILFAVNVCINLIAGLTARQAVGLQPQGAIVLQLALMAMQMVIGISYEVLLIGKYGATLGKMACKIKVVTADGGRVSYLRALGRYFAKILSYMICLIGFIIAAFDDQKRALHDHICNTRVVFN
ncbi:MAG: RDD family protein [Verrucomicrobiota bacterium]|jgi:uncharacterized RDD family membrane protein YckC